MEDRLQVVLNRSREFLARSVPSQKQNPDCNSRDRAAKKAVRSRPLRSARSPNERKETPDDPLREPPDHVPIYNEGFDGSAVTVDIDRHVLPRLWRGQRLEWCPKPVGHLVTRDDLGPGSREEIHERSDGQRGQAPYARSHIIQLPQPVGGLERESNFFLRLALCGIAERRIADFVASSGEGDVTRPGVIVAVRSSNEEHLRTIGRRS